MISYKNNFIIIYGYKSLDCELFPLGFGAEKYNNY